MTTMDDDMDDDNDRVCPQEPGFQQKCPFERSTNKNWESFDASQW
jgi:hypothetical protein